MEPITINPKTRLTITPQQYIKLQEIVDKNGNEMINVEGDFEKKRFTYEVFSMINKIGFDKTYSYLLSKNTKWESYDEVIFGSSILDPVIKNIIDEQKIIQRKVKVAQGVYKCRFCKGSNVSTKSVQLRSLDEPTNIFVKCNACMRTSVY